jgi:GTP pyrophosphokinase
MQNKQTYEVDYIKVEESIRFLCKAFPVSDDPIKPVLLHSTRVGVMLLNKGKNTDVCIAGFLHDTVEDSMITIDQIGEKFGFQVKDIVLANTKDENVEKEKRNEDLYKRCADFGIEACIVKAADIIDNIQYFREIGNEDAVDFAKHKRDAFLSFLPESFTDSLFKKLRDL